MLHSKFNDSFKDAETSSKLIVTTIVWPYMTGWRMGSGVVEV